MVSTSSTDGTLNAMWLTQAGVFGEGSAAVLSPRSKKAMQEPSFISKNTCANGVLSPVLGTWSP